MNNPSPKPLAAAPLSASDKTVLVYGAIAAVLGLTLFELVRRRLWPWGHPFALNFSIQWLLMAPLAGALLAGMQSGRRWLSAFAVYSLILPAITALGLHAVLSVIPEDRGAFLYSSQRALALLLSGAAGFILLPLIQALDARQAQWNYPAVFRAAWRNTVHLTLAACLALAVCLLLTAAGAMFNMIGIRIVQDVFATGYFRFAVWPMIFAICLVGVRRRPQLTETLQRSWLTLNAWLLPLVTLVGLAFTLALAAQMALGLQAVQLSAGALIAFSLVWIKLINAAWQDSPDAAPFGPVLRRLLRLGMLCLLPLSAVALYGAVVRVEQYGWTVLRAWGVASSIVLLLYGAGYAWAALRPKRYYSLLAVTNLFTAGVTLALLVAINTPIASPLRLTAESQLQRVIDGRQKPEKFPYYDMRKEFGQWGREALQQLAAGAADAQDRRIALAAAQALKGDYFRWDEPLQDPAQPAPDIPPLLTYPQGHELPTSWWDFLKATSSLQLRNCSTPIKPEKPGDAPTYRCQLIFADLTGDGQEELVLYVAPTADDPRRLEDLYVYEKTAGGSWRYMGRLQEQSFEQDMKDVTGVRDIPQALKQGLVRTVPRKDRDLMIGDQLLRMR